MLRVFACPPRGETMTEQQYDYGRQPAGAGSGQAPNQPPAAPPYQQANQPPPAPPYQASRQPHIVDLHKPFRTGIFLGFGFMVAALIVSVVLFIITMALGVSLFAPAARSL
jgi:hypothetical protein